MNILLTFIVLLAHHPALSDQTSTIPLDELNDYFQQQKPGTSHHILVEMSKGIPGYDLLLPVYLLKGISSGPKLAITAAIHGDEVTGVPVVNSVIKNIVIEQLRGDIIAIPVLNPFGLAAVQRGGPNGKDINRSFKMKKQLNVEEHYAKRLFDMLTAFNFDYHVDLHTATAKCDNSFYVRADFTLPLAMDMARTLQPEIILNSTSPNDSLRGAMLASGVHSVTVEMGGPDKVNQKFERKGIESLFRLLQYLGMVQNVFTANDAAPEPVICSESRWIYADYGGLAFLKVGIMSMVSNGQLLAEIQDFFGNCVSNVTSAYDGIVIGRTDMLPVKYGARLVHIGTIAS